MNESEFNIEITQADNATKLLGLYGDLDQSVARDLLTFLLGNALCKEKVVFDFKNTSGIDLTCLQIIASTILERNDKGLDTEFDVGGNECLSEFFLKTGAGSFLRKITNKQ